MKKALLWTVGGIAAAFVMFVGYAVVTGGDVKLHAEVSKSSTFVVIKNVESTGWTDCVATVNETFKSHTFALPAGERLTILLADFTAEDGLRFNPVMYIPKRVDLRCGPVGEHRIASFDAS